MGKNTELQTNLFSIFGDPAWVATGVVTFPEGFLGNTSSNEFIIVSIVASDAPTSDNKSSAGQVYVDIYVPAGIGPLRAAQIADLLDEHLATKTVANAAGSTQFRNSSFMRRGLDKANPNLLRFIYTTNFTHFGA
jgi:hypothetical protein